MPSNTVRPFWAKPAFGLLLAAAFLAVMALFFTFYDFYRDVGDNLVAGGGLEEPPLAASSSTPGGPWRGRGPRVEWESQGGFDGSGGVRLGTQPGRGSSLNYGVEDPARFQLLRIAGRLRTEHIVPGTHGWNTARLLLSFTDGSGERVHHAVCEIEGSTPWRLCERVIAVPEGAVAAQIHVQNLAASGTLWVDDLALTPVVKKSSTPFWRALFGSLWAAVLVYCAWLSRLLDRPLGFAIIAIVLVIIAGVAAPVSTIEEIVHRGADTVNGLTTADPFHAALPAAGSSDAPSRWTHEVRRALAWPFDLVFTVKKLGHFVLFGVLAFLALSSTVRRRHDGRASAGAASELATTGAALLLFAAAAEVVQFLSATRTPSLMDWGIDAGGIVLGGAVALLWSRFAGPPLARTNVP